MLIQYDHREPHRIPGLPLPDSATPTGKIGSPYLPGGNE
jgi:hypothetical protein